MPAFKIIFLLFMSMFHNSMEVLIRVDTCPGTELMWKQRSAVFFCHDQNEVYHCMQMKNNTLIEICLRPLNVSSFKDGCPWVHIHNGKPYLGNPFRKCDSNHSGCPGTSHEKYRTNELYLYPVCINSGLKTTSNGTGYVTDLPRSTTGTKIYFRVARLEIFFAVFVVATLVACVLYFLLCRGRLCKQQERATWLLYKDEKETDVKNLERPQSELVVKHLDETVNGISSLQQENDVMLDDKETQEIS